LPLDSLRNTYRFEFNLQKIARGTIFGGGLKPLVGGLEPPPASPLATGLYINNRCYLVAS